MAALVIVAADQLPIQLLVERKHSVLEMVAEDVVFGNQLHTGMRFSVVEQQTVAVHTVAALPPDQAADLPKLSCLNFNEHLTYFPDRQSCSTLCRQPSGCARSVEVVAVYPSLGSYSVVGLLRRASLPFKKPFTLNAKKSCKIYTLLRKIFAPSPIPNGKGHFLSLFQKFFAKK